MTTVEQLIDLLRKMPKDLPVSLNIQKNDYDYRLSFSEINIERKDFETPYCDPGSKQKFVIINQKGF